METLLIGIIAIVGYCEYFLGTQMIQRPIVMGTLVGLALGDLQKGLIIGASIELVFMGVASIGAAIPPEVTAGGILGTAFAIKSGSGPEVALALALPIATLGLLAKNCIYLLVRPVLAHKADKYAEEGNARGVEMMHYLSTFIFVLTMSFIVTLSFQLGSGVVKSFLQVVPDVITKGLSIATGLLPAVGFALLARMVMTRKVVPFFFLGFIIAAYLKVPVMGIAALGAVAALIIVGNENNTSKEVVQDDNEF
ncbi:PTS mannose/fructose/sorbose/N-acetylgalactosamine transporter subunit IIC [Clostridium oryzae]|uniref:N-acetylgalactosamine permease IIC component 1 n=1 Tax=Clostridium oryzae TaxID=1450648 RepID=A0A1V4IKN7_9CLOT|nr:PTS sugar transporter subunit IIC [Clostridium oryzae]OPJ60400.1 N-acetylgalactosamine permease IIC component 1 [Clostridium oryzae]